MTSETLAPGLSSTEAARRLQAEGANTLPEPARPHPGRQLVAQFTHLLALLLWIASGLALLAGMAALAVAIVVVVVLNAIFAFWQEYRADRSAERLRSLLPQRTRVRRDGVPLQVAARDVVRGDLVLLEAGDRVSADMELVLAQSLSADESLVTGESVPVPHAAGDPLMAGSFVVQGVGEALVTATGTSTTLAQVSSLAASATRPPSPLTRQLAKVVKLVAVIALATGVLLGLTGWFTGLDPTDAFLFGVGVMVALIPEGLLPTVTLSLARGAQLMAKEHALVRRLDAVETLGATTFICTDKTGTLTLNQMAVVQAWTPAGTVDIERSGYTPRPLAAAPLGVPMPLLATATHAVHCVAGRVVQKHGTWHAEGDPMDAALHCLALRCGWHDERTEPDLSFPFTSDRLMSSSVRDGTVSVLGAPEAVLAHCKQVPEEARVAVFSMTGRGQRVLAVATTPYDGGTSAAAVERDLELVGLLGLEDPPRPDVSQAIATCRTADIRVAMLTGDHVRTAVAIAHEIGLLGAAGTVVDGSALREDDVELGALLDNPAGAVVARVTPGGKLRIARVLRERGHVVAMTGDGVNDAPALREADVGVAMGASGSDVAREAADLVLLDDHFGTIVTAVRLGRSTFTNVRRFLTYHLTDNVAELAPFAVWAITGGAFPLAIGVLQVLALDIGTDMLPALALGSEPPSRRVMSGRFRFRSIVDRSLLLRAFAVLGPTEAVTSLVAFTVVLTSGGWSWGETPDAALLATASGTTFAAIALAQMANAFACRSEHATVWQVPPFSNHLLAWAVLTEGALLVAFVGLPDLADLLGGSWPTRQGWVWAGVAAVTLLVVDAVAKGIRHRAARPR